MARSKTPSLTWINDYPRQVVRGKITACKWVIQACRRHLDDLDRAKTKGYPYKFDRDKGLRAIRFIEQLPHTKGKWAQKRQQIELEPWQCFIIGCLFGWVRKSDGARRFREAYIEVARKNAKSTKAAGVGLFMLVADGEFGAEVYSGATSEKQAWEVFRPARLMAARTPDLTEYYGLEVNASNLLRVEDFSRFEPVIGNPGDGSSPSCALIDEYHEHATPDLYDTMATGMGSREQPLLFVITTAGSNLAGPCFEKRIEVQKILDGVFADDPESERVFGIIYTLDAGDDFKDRKNWIKANPNLGVSLSVDYLEAQVGAALRSPVRQTAVKTKHFNLWVGARDAAVNMEQWHMAADPTLSLADFAQDSAYVALDLATKVDIAARLTLFRRDIEGKTHYYAFPRFYVPEDALQDSKNARTYAGWAEEGLLEIMDGAEVDLNLVQEEILALPEVHPVAELVYDPWQATQLAQSVREQGVEAVEYRNTVGNMSPPMKELEAALAGGRFHHPGHKVLDWMASNVVAKEDAKENRYPRKEAPENKIDGMVALYFAIGRAMVQEEHGHAYQDRGFLTL